jgi:hypothetical protein
MFDSWLTNRTNLNIVIGVGQHVVGDDHQNQAGTARRSFFDAVEKRGLGAACAPDAVVGRVEPEQGAVQIGPLGEPNFAEIVDGLAGAATGVENDDGALRGHFEQLGDGGDDSVLRGKKPCRTRAISSTVIPSF